MVRQNMALATYGKMNYIGNVACYQIITPVYVSLLLVLVMSA